MNIKKNVSLQALHTFSAPSVARYYVSADSVDDLRAAVLWARAQGVTFYVLGGGSNTIPCDFIDGLVVQPKIMGICQQQRADGAVLVTAAAGESWHDVVMRCVEGGLCGLENLALIPGDCGAAPIQNIGAYGVELKDIFVELTALNVDSLKLEKLSRDRCQFSYRHSVFKGEAKGKYIITDITLALSKKHETNIEYGALKDEAARRGIVEPSVQEIAQMVIAIRKSKLPDPLSIPNAGSFFKNPVVTAAHFAKLQSRFPSIVAYPTGENCYKVPAAWLLDTLGWKGKSVHGIKVHDHHALVLTNPRRMGASKILLAAEEIQRDVELAFGIRLEMEPQVLGALS